MEHTGVYYGPVVAKVVEGNVLLICYIDSTYEQLETFEVDAYKRVDGKLKLLRARTGLTNYSPDNFLTDVIIADGAVYGIGNLGKLTYAVAPICLANVLSEDDATNGIKVNSRFFLTNTAPVSVTPSSIWRVF